MPYYRRPTTSRRRPTRRGRRYGRRVVRRSTRPTRFSRPYISRRHILNIASKKKHDVRLSFSNIANGANPPTQGGAVLNGNTLYIIPYVPTAMDKEPSSGTDFELDNYRSADDVYMRGYREVFRVVASNGTAWMWRRVCFTMKGDKINEQATATVPLGLEVSPNGWTRTITQANGSPLGDRITDTIFTGTEGIDWSDVFSAKVDTTSVTIKHDTTKILRGGNGETRFHINKMWHPMNANFHYDTKENGDESSDSVWHTDAQPGMGDYYIVDFIQASSNNAAHTLAINYEGCLYWHER